jgi:hypothetical protein
VPAPRTFAPIALSILARSWTWGSRAALMISVRPEARVADLPLQDPKLMPKDREFSLAIVCRTTPTGSDQAVDQGLEGRRRGERRARAPEMLAVWSTGPLRAKEAFWGPGAVSKPHAARAEDYPREPGHLLGLTID